MVRAANKAFQRTPEHSASFGHAFGIFAPKSSMFGAAELGVNCTRIRASVMLKFRKNTGYLKL